MQAPCATRQPAAVPLLGYLQRHLLQPPNEVLPVDVQSRVQVLSVST